MYNKSIQPHGTLRFCRGGDGGSESELSSCSVCSKLGLEPPRSAPFPDCHVLSSLPLPLWSHLTRTLPSGSLHFCPYSLLNSALLEAGQRHTLLTTSSCCINKSPYLLIIQLFGSQIHSGGRFSNNQSSSRAEQWKMEGFDFELGGGFFKGSALLMLRSFKNCLPIWLFSTH